jgi:hypothetical protein
MYNTAWTIGFCIMHRLDEALFRFILDSGLVPVPELSSAPKRVDSMDESPNWDLEGLLRRVGTVQVMIFRIIEYRKRTKQSTVLGWRNAKSSALALLSSLLRFTIRSSDEWYHQYKQQDLRVVRRTQLG